jgi:hypothetical protein
MDKYIEFIKEIMWGLATLTVSTLMVTFVGVTVYWLTDKYINFLFN